MEIRSPAFEDKKLMPYKYTCDGENINPPLRIRGIPAGTESLILFFQNQDEGHAQWVLWNIDPRTNEIKEGSIPKGCIEGFSDFRVRAYIGPCPEHGIKQYAFILYAIDIKLGLNQNTKKEELMESIKDNILDIAELNCKYARFKSFIIPCKCEC